MKKLSKIAMSFIFIASIIFSAVGCKPEVEPTDTSDKTAPAEVTNLKAEQKGLAVLLTWTDASDSDIFGYEVSYSGEKPIDRAVSKMEANTLFVSPGNEGILISNLENAKSYTFTVKSMDTNGNKSNGVTTESVTISLSEKQPLEIKTALSTKELTNQNIAVNVSIATDGESSVKKISYQKGFFYKVDEVLESGTDITEEKSFEASENGEYTIAASDTDGRREITWITVSNIDKTSPKAVVNLMAVYDYASKKITVTWDTSDTDIDYYLISYKIGDETKASDVKVSEKNYSLSDIEAGTDAYTFTVKAVDKAGNQSDAAETSITPKNVPLVSSIELDRKHIAYNDTNKTINVTVKGSNFDLISSQTDSSFKIQVVDSSDNVTNYDATVNTTNNTATATITAPTLSSSQATVAGTDYTVRAKVCGTIDKEHTAALNISSAAAVSSVSLSTSQISVDSVTSGQTTTATVTGTNFDVAGTITLQLYDSKNVAYGGAITVDTSGFEMHQTSFTVQVPIPTVDDKYTLRLLFDGTAQSKTASLQVYGSPVFTSFKIPYAGISKEDNQVTATVIGKNFTAPNVTSDSFTVTCSENSSITNDSTVKVLSDSMLGVTLTIPSSASGYKVTITSGSKSLDGIFTVKDYSSYKVGQIILADGTLADSSSYSEINTNNPPVAVVAGFNEYGMAFGVGLHQSEKELMWAPKDTTGFNTKFEDIICTLSNTGGRAASTATFTGDTDGSDNWDVICSVDPEGSADAAKNYPAFNWANTYGETYKDYLGGVTEDWYMPSLAELCYVYRNITTINETLKAINKLNPGYAHNEYNPGVWSSSQVSESSRDVLCVLFSADYVLHQSKNDTYSVLVIRAF